MNKSLIVLFLIFNNYIFSQVNYKRYIDSADNYCHENPKLARFFLEKIPKPFDKSIQGSIARYYQLSAIVSNIMNERSNCYRDYLLALKYGEEEKNYSIAGMASIELYSDIYWDLKDTITAKRYLILAKKFYTLDNNKVGLLEVSQLKAYEKYANKEYGACRKMILKDLPAYRLYSKKDAYSLLFGLVMLTISELKLKMYDEAYKHYIEFKKLRKAPKADGVYDRYKASVETYIAQEHYENGRLDSAFFYLKNVQAHRKVMSAFNLQRYFNLYMQLYEANGNLQKSKAYVDSLSDLQNIQIKESLEAAYEMNTALMEVENQTKVESRKKNTYILSISALTIILLSALLYYFRKQKKLSIEKKIISKNAKNLEVNNQQLTVKVSEIGSYIKNLKTNIKKISAIHEKEPQNKAIQALYHELHLDASQIFNDQTAQFALINQLKSDFIIKLKNNFPALDDQDIIICYYVYSGFMNKEIATFLSTTIRGVEGKRYRISKKIGLSEQNLKLNDFLKIFF